MDSLNGPTSSDLQFMILNITKFYPFFCFREMVQSQARRHQQHKGRFRTDSVFNIIFKKAYLARYMEVSGKYPEYEARSHG